MKNSVSIFILLTLLSGFIACKKEKNEPPVENKPLLLSKVFLTDTAGQNKKLALEIMYAAGALNEVKQVAENGSLITLINGFTFDAQQRITGFTRSENDFRSFTDFKLFYANDKLSLVQVFTRTGSTTVLDHTVSLSYTGNAVTSTTLGASGQPLDKTVATYTAGNTESLKKFSGGLVSNTIQFFSYDNHPNTFDKLIEQIGANDFLPASKNNPGVVVQTFDNGTTHATEISYQYNQQGLPLVKKEIDPTQPPLLFEYIEAP